MARLPTLYVPHGGGPWPWIDAPPLGGDAMQPLRDYLTGLPSVVGEPRAIVCITAHWEAPVVTVSTSKAPPMLYDYSGFPPHTYEVQWGAPGQPELAERVRSLLSTAGVPNNADPARGFDHGTFVPLSVAWPGAEVPTVQVSLVRGLAPDAHLAIGRALRPLRDEGVLIVGSGMSYHNMRGFFSGQGARDAELFDTWLRQAVTQAPDDRDQALAAWERAPAARAAHPREEHLLPLMVVAGAAGDDVGTVPFSQAVLGARVSAIQFG